MRHWLRIRQFQNCNNRRGKGTSNGAKYTDLKIQNYIKNIKEATLILVHEKTAAEHTSHRRMQLLLTTFSAIFLFSSGKTNVWVWVIGPPFKSYSVVYNVNWKGKKIYSERYKELFKKEVFSTILFSAADKHWLLPLVTWWIYKAWQLRCTTKAIT